MGWEEFLIMTRSSNRSGISVFCDRILSVIASEHFELSNHLHLRKTCSIGWAPYPWCHTAVEALCPEDVIDLADAALFQAKREGRNRSVGFVPSQTAMASPERINPASLRDEQADLIPVVKPQGVSPDTVADSLSPAPANEAQG